MCASRALLPPSAGSSSCPGYRLGSIVLKWSQEQVSQAAGQRIDYTVSGGKTEILY